MNNFEKKRVLVTGSTQGMGMAIAKRFASEGAAVYTHGLPEQDEGDKLFQDFPSITYISQDLSADDAAEKIFSKTGPVDILVLNASVQFRHEWDQHPDEEIITQIKVNLLTSYHLVQKYTPGMKESKYGRIITIGSVQQVDPNKQMLIYAATKSAQMNAVISMARELAQYGITVNNIAPGTILTPRNEEALSNPEYAKEVASWIPIPRIGKPEDVLGAVMLAAGEEGSYMTGNNIWVDGGMHL